MNILMKLLVIVGLITISPIIVLSIFLVLLEDGRPVIFKQKRLGKKKKEFTLYKIRTMYKSAPNLGTHEVSKSYYLNYGSFIRKFKVDELPQLVNYLKGEINLIGPRPGMSSQIELKEYRDIHNIFSVKPGITGFAQILGYDMSNPEVLAKIDKLYIKKKSVKLDLKIFFGTFFKSIRTALKLKYKLEIEKIIK